VCAAQRTSTAAAEDSGRRLIAVLPPLHPLPPAYPTLHPTRTVQKHNLGVRHQRERHRQPPPHPPRVLPRVAPPNVGQRHLRQPLVDLCLPRGAGHALQRRKQAHVLRPRQTVKQHVVLRAHAEQRAEARHVVLDAVAVHGRVAARHGREAREHVEGRRLARAIVAEQAKEAVVGDGHGHVVDGHDRLEGFAEVPQHDRAVVAEARVDRLPLAAHVGVLGGRVKGGGAVSPVDGRRRVARRRRIGAVSRLGGDHGLQHFGRPPVGGAEEVEERLRRASWGRHHIVKVDGEHHHHGARPRHPPVR